jgi:hypothetical protein
MTSMVGFRRGDLAQSKRGGQTSAEIAHEMGLPAGLLSLWAFFPPKKASHGLLLGRPPGPSGSRATSHLRQVADCQTHLRERETFSADTVAASPVKNAAVYGDEGVRPLAQELGLPHGSPSPSSAAASAAAAAIS